jgi:hypothetical protein
VFDDHFHYLGLPMAKTLFEAMSDHSASNVVSLAATATLMRSLHRSEEARRAVLAARGVAMGCFDEMSRESGVAMAVLGSYYTCNPPPPPSADNRPAEDPHRAEYYLSMADATLRPLVGQEQEDIFSVCAVVEYKRYRLRFDPEWRGEGPSLSSEEPPDALFRRVPTMAHAREVFDSLIEARRVIALRPQGGGDAESVGVQQRLSELLAPTDEALRRAMGYAVPKFMLMWAHVVRGAIFLAAGDTETSWSELRKGMDDALCPSLVAYRGTVGMIYLSQQLYEAAVASGEDDVAVKVWKLMKEMGNMSVSARRLAGLAEVDLAARFGDTVLVQ